MEKDIAQLFADDPNFTTFNELMAQLIQELPRLEELYTVSRDKVCELTAARAVTRPLKPAYEKRLAETRADAIQKSKGIVNTLSGELPPRLGVPLDHAERM